MKALNAPLQGKNCSLPRCAARGLDLGNKQGKDEELPTNRPIFITKTNNLIKNPK
jgi:hypothetical protein